MINCELERMWMDVVVVPAGIWNRHL